MRGDVGNFRGKYSAGEAGAPATFMDVALGAVLLAGLLVFLNVGRWLVSEDPLQKADAIAVLSGRMPSRALEAARVYKQGYASRVWLTHSTEPGATLEQLAMYLMPEKKPTTSRFCCTKACRKKRFRSWSRRL